jgi:hypothetical protein
MKAKNISGRLARFLAVLTAMILIVSCMAVPVALAEGSTNTSTQITTESDDQDYTFLVAISGFEKKDYSKLQKTLSKSFKGKVSKVENVPIFDRAASEESERIIFLIVGKKGGSRLYGQMHTPDMLIFLDACYILDSSGTEDDNAMIWLSYLSEMALCGSDIYIFSSSSGTDENLLTQKVIALFESYATSDNPTFTPEYGETALSVEFDNLPVTIELPEDQTAETSDESVENAELVYIIKGYDYPEPLDGCIHIVFLDMNEKDSRQYVFDYLCDYINSH